MRISDWSSDVCSSDLYAWGDYSQSVEKKHVVLTKLTKRQQDLQNRVNLLDGRRVDPDLADEYVREKLGVMHPDEIAIPMDGNENGRASGRERVCRSG